MDFWLRKYVKEPINWSLWRWMMKLLGRSPESSFFISPVAPKWSPAQVLLLPIAYRGAVFLMSSWALVQIAAFIQPWNLVPEDLGMMWWLKQTDCSLHKDHLTSCRNTVFIFSCSCLIYAQLQRSGQRGLCVFSTFVLSHTHQTSTPSGHLGSCQIMQVGNTNRIVWS